MCDESLSIVVKGIQIHCCRDTNKTTVSSMANYEYISVDAQIPESVLSVVDLEHESDECVLLITEQENGPVLCGFQHHSVNPELHQQFDPILTGKKSVDLFHAEEVEMKPTDPYETAKTGALKTPVQIQNSHNVKVNNCKPLPIFICRQNERHPCVRRSQKNIRLNDPHAFSSPRAGLSRESSCGDSIGEPLIHSKQQHFIASAAEDAANLRCKQRNFKIRYGDQEVDGSSQDPSILSAQYLTSCKERSLAILQDNRANSKEVGEKSRQKKGCFKKLLELCFITKNKQKTVKSYCTSPEAGVHPILPQSVITNTQAEDPTLVSRNCGKDTRREGHHPLTEQLYSRQNSDPILFADDKQKFKIYDQGNEKHNP